MQDLKPIETLYNGFRFRSRLEARWAVFFDAMHLEYQYELEGYALPGGGAYLPDFYLPETGLFVEVKPHHELSIDDIRKLVLFGVDGDKSLLLIAGVPTAEHMYLVARSTLGPWEELRSDYDSNDESIRISFWELLESFGAVKFGTTPLNKRWQLIFKEEPHYEGGHIQQSMLKAKQARFEFGQTPVPPHR